MQIAPMMTAPHRFWEMKNVCVFFSILLIFHNPYPPSLSKIPARTILPESGASTWALGSHRCTPHIGILTRNAPRRQAEESCVCVNSWPMMRGWWLVCSSKMYSKGKEKQKVYIKK